MDYLYNVWGDEMKNKFLSHGFMIIMIIAPTFDTKVTECLCSGWVFFSSDKFRLFN